MSAIGSIIAVFDNPDLWTSAKFLLHGVSCYMRDYGMTPELHAMLLEWTKTGDDIQRRHAEHRLSLPDAINYKPPKFEYPSFVQQAKNAAIAVGATIASVIRGEAVNVPKEEQDRRLAICHACEFWDSKQGRCSKCGCLGQWKTWLASQHCPLDPPKW